MGRPGSDPSVRDGGAADNSRPDKDRPGGAPEAIVPIDSTPAAQSMTTVLVAFGVNLLIAVAKSVAALLTGSASLVAESAHSWADTGNEIFLVIADRRARRPPEPGHSLGYGREAYVWALFSALGVFVAGSTVSVTHGVHQLMFPEPAADFAVGFLVLAVAFVLEGVSFLQSTRQARREARGMDLEVLEHVLATSDPTLRAVFTEDLAALVGVVIAALGLTAHQITGSSAPDAIGSILVGVLLGVVALMLINRNHRFLVGQEVDPRVRAATLRALLDLPEVDRVTFLRLEFVGPRQLFVVADVDLTGDDSEPRLAVRLRDLEDRVSSSPAVVATTLSLSAPDEQPLRP